MIRLALLVGEDDEIISEPVEFEGQEAMSGDEINLEQVSFPKTDNRRMVSGLKVQTVDGVSIADVKITNGPIVVESEMTLTFPRGHIVYKPTMPFRELGKAFRRLGENRNDRGL